MFICGTCGRKQTGEKCSRLLGIRNIYIIISIRGILEQCNEHIVHDLPVASLEIAVYSMKHSNPPFAAEIENSTYRVKPKLHN